MIRQPAQPTPLCWCIPPVVVEGTLAILGNPTSDERAVSPHVEEVLGRPARGFGEWARRFAATFAA